MANASSGAQTVSASKVCRLKIEPLTPEAFAPFGVLLDARERPADRWKLTYDEDFSVVGRAKVGVIWEPFAGLTFTRLERHFNVTQAFVPMSGSLSVVAVAAPTDPGNADAIPKPKQVRAFLIDGSMGFRYHVGTWHSLSRFILHPPGATYVIINVDPNPTQVVDYAERSGVCFEVVL